MTTLAFTIPGPPVACGRARVVRRGAHAHAFTPEKTASYERHVHVCALAAASKLPAWRRDWAWYSIEISVHRETETGDADNYLKAAMDGCKGVLWPDDARVQTAHVDIYESPTNPHAVVRVTLIGDETLDEYRKRRRSERDRAARAEKKRVDALRRTA